MVYVRPMIQTYDKTSLSEFIIAAACSNGYVCGCHAGTNNSSSGNTCNCHQGNSNTGR